MSSLRGRATTARRQAGDQALPGRPGLPQRSARGRPGRLRGAQGRLRVPWKERGGRDTEPCHSPGPEPRTASLPRRWGQGGANPLPVPRPPSSSPKRLFSRNTELIVSVSSGAERAGKDGEDRPARCFLVSRCRPLPSPPQLAKAGKGEAEAAAGPARRPPSAAGRWQRARRVGRGGVWACGGPRGKGFAGARLPQGAGCVGRPVSSQRLGEARHRFQVLWRRYKRSHSFRIYRQ